MPSVAPTRRRPLQALARAASWHRRKLAMLAAVAAVLTGISAAAPEGPAMISVVKARSQLPAGSVVSTADLLLDRVAASDVPDGVLTDPVALVGKTLAAPVAENQMMTPLAATDARTSVPRARDRAAEAGRRDTGGPAPARGPDRRDRRRPTGRAGDRRRGWCQSRHHSASAGRGHRLWSRGCAGTHR